MASLIKKMANENDVTTINDSSTKVTLTTKRVYQEDTSGGSRKSTIIPLENTDSFAFQTQQKIWLLVVGILFFIYGIYSLIQDLNPSARSDIFGTYPGHAKVGEITIIVLALALIFVAAWIFTRKIGAAIISFSGKSEIFIRTLGMNSEKISEFFLLVQEQREKINSSNTVTSPQEPMTKTIKPPPLPKSTPPPIPQ